VGIISVGFRVAVDDHDGDRGMTPAVQGHSQAIQPAQIGFDIRSEAAVVKDGQDRSFTGRSAQSAAPPRSSCAHISAIDAMSFSTDSEDASGGVRRLPRCRPAPAAVTLREPAAAALPASFSFKEAHR
jgi:hypothetical protein